MSAINADPRAVQAAPCPGGGTIDATCAERGGRTTVAARSTDCVLIDERRGVREIVSGALEVSIEAPGVCQSGEVPPAAPRTLRYRHFRATVYDGPVVIESFAAPLLTQRIEPSARGCADVGHVALDGRLLVARTNAVDVTLDAHGLELALTAGGVPCFRQVEARGRLDVFDHVSGRQFAAALRGLRVSFEAGSVALVAALDGAATLDCIGEIVYATEVPLSIAGPCASAGTIHITLPSGSTARTRSGAGGVEFDYDGDGNTDRFAASCSRSVPHPMSLTRLCRWTRRRTPASQVREVGREHAPRRQGSSASGALIHSRLATSRTVRPPRRSGQP